MNHEDPRVTEAAAPTPSTTRRRFLQGSIAAAAGALGVLPDSQAAMARAGSRSSPGSRPNILIIMVDEMRYPPIYESQATKAFRQQYLQTQNALRGRGLEFNRHYAASVACSPRGRDAARPVRPVPLPANAA